MITLPYQARAVLWALPALNYVVGMVMRLGQILFLVARGGRGADRQVGTKWMVGLGCSLRQSSNSQLIRNTFFFFPH